MLMFHHSFIILFLFNFLLHYIGFFLMFKCCATLFIRICFYLFVIRFDNNPIKTNVSNGTTMRKCHRQCNKKLNLIKLRFDNSSQLSGRVVFFLFYIRFNCRSTLCFNKIQIASKLPSPWTGFGDFLWNWK